MWKSILFFFYKGYPHRVVWFICPYAISEYYSLTFFSYYYENEHILISYLIGVEFPSVVETILKVSKSQNFIVLKIQKIYLITKLSLFSSKTRYFSILKYNSGYKWSRTLEVFNATGLFFKLVNHDIIIKEDCYLKSIHVRPRILTTGNSCIVLFIKFKYDIRKKNTVALLNIEHKLYPIFSEHKLYPIFSEHKLYPIFSEHKLYPIFSEHILYPIFSEHKLYPIFSEYKL